jgi:hypothetical protein
LRPAAEVDALFLQWPDEGERAEATPSQPTSIWSVLSAMTSISIEREKRLSIGVVVLFVADRRRAGSAE